MMKRYLFLIGGLILSVPVPILASGEVALVRSRGEPSRTDPSDNVVALSAVVVNAVERGAAQVVAPGLGTRVFELSSDTLKYQGQGFDASFDQLIIHAPGVAQDSSGQYHVRCEDADLQYRINGILLPEGIWTTVGQQFDSLLIGNLSLIAGALPAQYGLRTSGVIDIQTKAGRDLSGEEVSVYMGSRGLLRPSFTAGGIDGKTSVIVIGGYSQSDLGTNNVTPERDAIHDRTRQYQGFGFLSHDMGELGKLNVIVSGLNAHFQIPNAPGLEPSFSLAGRDEFDSSALDRNQIEENYYGIVAYNYRAEDVRIQLAEVTGFASTHYVPDRVGDLLFTGVASNARRSLVNHTLQLDVSYYLSDTQMIRGGLVATAQKERTDTMNDVFPVDSEGEVLSDTPERIHDVTAKQGYLYGVYLQHERQLGRDLTMNVGARFDLADGYLRESQISPRLNFSYNCTPSTTLHAGYSRYFTPPQLEYISPATFREYLGTTNAPNSLLDDMPKSERADYYDVGMVWGAGPGLTTGADFYYKSVRNMQDEEQFGSALMYTPFTYRDGYKMGAEFTVTYQKAAWNAYANLGISRTKGRSINSTQGLFDEEELDYIGSHYIHVDHDQLITGSAGVSYRAGATILHSDALYGSGMFGGFVNKDRVPSHAVVNVGVEHSFGAAKKGSLTMRLDVTNVFDSSYILHEAGIGITSVQYGDRRGIFVGIDYNF